MEQASLPQLDSAFKNALQFFGHFIHECDKKDSQYLVFLKAEAEDSFHRWRKDFCRPYIENPDLDCPYTGYCSDRLSLIAVTFSDRSVAEQLMQYLDRDGFSESYRFLERAQYIQAQKLLRIS